MAQSGALLNMPAPGS